MDTCTDALQCFPTSQRMPLQGIVEICRTLSGRLLVEGKWLPCLMHKCGGHSGMVILRTHE